MKLKRSIPPLNETVCTCMCACLPALSVCLKIMQQCIQVLNFGFWFSNLLALVFCSLIWYLVLWFGIWFSDLVFGLPIWFLVLQFGFWFSNLVFGSPIWYLVLWFGFWLTNLVFGDLMISCLTVCTVLLYDFKINHIIIALLLAIN